MSAPAKTGCSPSPPALCSSACSRCFQLLPFWCQATACSPTPRPSVTIYKRLSLMLPDGSFQIVQDQIARVLAKGNTALGATFLLGAGLAIWSANAGVKAVIDALNVVYEEREKRSFIKLNLLSLAFTTAGILALLLMVGAVVALPLVLDHLWLGSESKIIVSLARWPLLLVMLLLALGILYRYGPSRRAARGEWLSVGTLAAALLWIAGSALLSWYLSNFGNYNATYGTLGAAIGLMMWMWMSAIIVLWGAELNSEIEHQTAVDTTVGHPKPLGASGAAMADSLGPVPVVNQIRTYWWCSPPRTGRQRMVPASLTARETGASFSKDKCVLISL